MRRWQTIAGLFVAAAGAALAPVAARAQETQSQEFPIPQVAQLRPHQEPGAEDPQPYYAQNFGGWMTRYFQNSQAALQGIPSAVLIREPRHTQPLTADIPVRPRYSRDNGRIQVELPLPEGASVYGLGPSGGGLLRNGFEGQIAPLHGVVVVVLSDGSAYGALLDTTAPLAVKVNETLRFEAEAATLPVIIVAAESAMEVVTMIADLTGHVEMPPRWALGFSAVAKDLEQADALVQSGDLPAASLWVPAAQPGPGLKRLGLAAAEKQVRIGAIFDPLNASTPRETAPDAALAFAAEHRIIADLTHPEGVKWWRSAIAALKSSGMAAAMLQWPPAIEAPEARFAGENWWGPDGVARYGPLLPRLYGGATRSGIAPDEHGDRPVVHTTRWVIGAQQHGGVLVDAGPEALRQVLHLSMSGVGLVGIRGESVDELATALAAMPLAVGVLVDDGALAGDQELLRQLLEVRTRLIPYMYTLTYNAFVTGQPIIRPVFFADPSQPHLREIDWAYLLGPDLLVVPRSDGQQRECPLPGWRRLDFGAAAAMPDLYLRPGAILPTADAQQRLGEETSPLILLAHLDESGQARSTLYEDDGDGYAFYRNACRRMGHRVDVQGEHAFVRLSLLDGGSPIPDRELKVTILTDDGIIQGEGSERGTIRIPLQPAAVPPR